MKNDTLSVRSYKHLFLDWLVSGGCTILWEVSPYVWLVRHSEGDSCWDVCLVRNAYQILTSNTPRLEVVTSNSFWHADVPLKVSLLAWWLLHNRLLTKDNLCYRGVIDLVSFRFLQTPLRISYYSLNTLHVVLNRVVRLWCSFGLCAYGLYGKKGIPWFLMTKLAQILNCWIM